MVAVHTFKMAYQIGNIENPNRKENTTICSIFEAKDSISNLRTCLDRFKREVNLLQTRKWNNFSIRLFMYGDYEFLCALYGITGANGKLIFFYTYKHIHTDTGTHTLFFDNC